jgi:hypothetical protein
MNPEEIAIAAGALSAALLDMLISKQVLTRQEAAMVTGAAMGRVAAIKGIVSGGDAVLILSRLGERIAATDGE